MTKAIDKPIKFSQLVALAAVAEQGGFSAAALQLGLAQSTVSHAIASLEEDLGVVLLLRNRSGAVLTPIGQQIYQQAKEVLNKLEEIRKTANRTKELQTGRVRVATVRTVATHILPDVIARFRQAHPNIGVEIIECDLYREVENALREGKVEVGITLMPISSEFQSWELFRDEFVALLPPLAQSDSQSDHKSVNQIDSKADSPSDLVKGISEDKPLTWEVLVDAPRVVNSRASQHNELIDEHARRFGYQFSAHPQMRSDFREDSTLTGLVAKGLGIAVLSRLEAEPIPLGVRVKSLPDPLERIVGVAILERAVLPRAVFAFLDVLLSSPFSIAD